MNRPREDLEKKANSIENNNVFETNETPQLTHHQLEQYRDSRDDHQMQNELKKCMEFSQAITHLQQELSTLRASLSKSYWPELEAQVQRLSIERDETIISWGQTLLGLCSSGAQLKLHTNSEILNIFGKDGDSSSLNHQSSLPLGHSENLYSEGSFTDQFRPLNEGRILGRAGKDDLYPSLKSSYAIGDEVGESNQVDDINEAEDFGVADAPKVNLTQFSLEELREQMLQPKSWGADEEEDKSEEADSHTGKELALDLVKRLGSPRKVSSSESKEYLIELEAEVECCQSWSALEQEVQHAVVTLVTSRLRDIQDYIGESPFDQDRIAKMFRRLTRFSSDFRPGFIHGLSREKVPEFESWKNDEVKAWERLQKLLEIEPNLPKLTPEREEKLERLKNLLTQEDDNPDFSNSLRAAVTECLNSGFSQESPHLIQVLESHLSHLSGKRFKKLRLAASVTRV